MPYSPLGKGFLTGKMNENTQLEKTDFRSQSPRFQPEAMKTNQAFVQLLGEIAKQKDATPAQIALAWLLAQKAWIVPIPGSTKLSRLQENVGGASLVLTSGYLAIIKDGVSKLTVEGNRYSEDLEKLTGR